MIRSRLMSAMMVAAAAIGFTATSASAQNEAQVVVGKADTTLSNFLRDPEMKWLQQNFGRAKAVIIVPEIVKAGFIIGGSGGRGLVVAKQNGTGKWVGPRVLHAGHGKRGASRRVSLPRKWSRW